MFERTKLTPPQLAQKWGISCAKVIGFIRSGELRAVNLASRRSTRPRYVIDLEDIATFEASREVVPQNNQSPRPTVRRRTEEGVKKFF